MRIDRVTWPDIKAYLATRDTILMPIGATECYGPHLALGTEMRICEAFATEVGARTGLAVAPIVPFNYSHLFLDYPGTCTVETATLERYVGEVCDNLAGQGFRRFFFINVHNGSLAPLESISRRLRTTRGAMGGLIDVFNTVRDVGGVAWVGKQAPTAHGAEMVTSLALHVCPELVFMDRAQDPGPMRAHAGPATKPGPNGRVAFDGSGFTLFSSMRDDSPSGIRDDPRHASAEKGATMWENALAFGVKAATVFATMPMLGTDTP